MYTCTCTKVMHHGSGWIKADSIGSMGGNCANDGVPSKPTSVGRGRSDDPELV